MPRGACSRKSDRLKSALLTLAVLYTICHDGRLDERPDSNAAISIPENVSWHG
jgi:hypothetical protein